MALTRPLNLSKFSENGGVTAKPLILDDVVYLGAMDNYFYAIDAKTGEKIWTFKANGAISTDASSDGSALYFGSYDHNLYAVSFEGELLWKFRTNGLVASSPKILGKTVYFGSSDNNFYAIDLETHSELWRFRTGDEIVSDPLIIENRIYFGSMDSYFYCLDTRGNLLWKFKANDAILMGQPASDENGIYFGSVDETLYALDFGGNLRWGFKTAEQVYNSALVLNGRVYFCGRDRHIYCLDSNTGACIWKFMAASDMYCPPVIHNNLIFFGAENIYALTMDGYKIWGIPIDGMQVGMNGMVFGNNVIFSSFDCKIRSIAFDGKINWVFRTNGVLAPLETFIGIVPAPKWNPEMFDPDTVKKSVTFNPYAFSKDSGLKIYGGLDTTEIKAYAAMPRGLCAYQEKTGSAGAYAPKGRKKGALDEILEEQVKKQFGI